MEDALDTDVFRIVSSSALESILDGIAGPKTLVLQPSLGGPLGLITQVAQLKNHGVQRMFWLDKGPLANAERNVVYLCRPEARWMRIIADQIKAQTHVHQHHLIAVPRMTAPCTALLTALGVLGSLEVHEFQMGLIPVDPDVLSLESDDVHKRMALDNDLGDVYDMAKALMTVQRAFGSIPRFVGKGAGAERLFSLLKRFTKEMVADDETLYGGSVDSIIAIDRQVDMVTPLSTQLTYEGLLDEVIGIRNAHVEVDPALVEPQTGSAQSAPSSSNATTPKNRKHRLASSDRLFETMRDHNFAAVGPILNRHAKRLNEEYERRHEAHEPSQLRAFVGQLGTLQEEHAALRLHTALAAEIMKTTETDEFNIALEIQQNLIAGIDLSQQESSLRELINREASLVSVLRLFCIYSIVSNGLKQKTIEELKKEILQTYGHFHLPLLTHLSTLGLISKTASGKSPFAQSRKPLRLLVPDDDDKAPTDIAHVFSGYAPLSVRLVQCAIGNHRSITGWKGIEDVVRALPGATLDADLTSSFSPPQKHERRNVAMPTTIVCFLGGITYAEIAALRFLNRQMTHRNLVIVTTNVVSGRTLLTSLMPGPTRPPTSS